MKAWNDAVKRISVLIILALMAACATQPEREKTTPKPAPAARQAPAKVYTLEAPSMPRPEVLPSPEDGAEPGPDGGTAERQVLLGNTREGIPVYLSDFRGKMVLVNYWASWCPPCWAEMPQLEAIYADFRHRGLEVVAVNYGEGDKAVDNFVHGQVRPLSFHIVMDPDTTLSREQGVLAVPTTVLYDSDGRVVQRYTGIFGFSAGKVRNELHQLLKNANRS